jgi:prepilin-type N-terminal cleavage/methylation domain-containing protein
MKLTYAQPKNNGLCGLTRRGFTLLELTISIALIGIIILVVAGTLRLGYRSVEAGEKRIESLERIRSSFNIVDSQIQSFVPLSYEDQGEKKYYFKGDRGLMQFSTNYSIWGGEKGYVIATYTITTADNGKQILSAAETVVGMGSGRETKLFTNFDTISFAYFFKGPAEEEGKWADQMTQEDGLPEKVALRLTEGVRDFTMVIPLRAAAGLEGQIVSGSALKGN